jgi:eukaryotic-like serine/threonine-protein kinase
LDHASAPTRAKLPIALRIWTQAQHPLRGLYMAWTGVFTMGFISQFRMGRMEPMWIMGAFALLPLIPMSVFHLRKSYQTLSAGYTLRDLRAALAIWQQERRDELAYESSEEEPRWARWMRSAAYVLVPSLAYAFFFHRFPNTLASKIFIVTVVGGSIATVGLGSALGVRFFSAGLRSKLIGAIRSTFWNSSLGAWAAKLLTPGKRKSVADLDYRPTEMALGVAAEELYKALPREYREHVPDLPIVVERLEAHAAAARARVEEIDAMAAMGSIPAELATARDRAKRKLAESVASLETIRLDLLRLHGGASDLRSITTVLDAARDLGDQLERLNEAQKDVERIPLPWDLRPHTPT